MRTQAEIEALLDENLADGPGSDYEDGVQMALNWVLGIAGVPL